MIYNHPYSHVCLLTMCPAQVLDRGRQNLKIRHNNGCIMKVCVAPVNSMCLQIWTAAPVLVWCTYRIGPGAGFLIFCDSTTCFLSVNLRLEPQVISVLNKLHFSSFQGYEDGLALG